MDIYLPYILPAVLGISGYALMARASLRSLIPSVVAGMLGTCLYLFVSNRGFPEFLSNLLGATVIYICCGIAARIWKAPVTIFLLPAQIILVPGGYLYHTVSYFINGEYARSWETCLSTIEVAAGIASGMVCGLVIFTTATEILAAFSRLIRKISKKHT